MPYLTADQLSDALRKAGVPEPICQAVAPCIRLVSQSVEDEDGIPVGASKMGGHPDLPDDFDWPVVDDVPLSFLVQIRLDDLPHLPGSLLPKSGLLTFWYDTFTQPWGMDNSEMSLYQVHLHQTDRLGRRDWPAFDVSTLDDDPINPWQPFQACAIQAHLSSSIEPNEFANALGPDDYELEQRVLDIADQTDNQGNGLHRLLGYPKQIQGDIRYECQYLWHNLQFSPEPTPEEEARAAELAEGISEWRLLLQIDSDDGPGWMWGDAGCLYFCIRDSDLRAGHFEQVCGILQCS